MCTSLKNPTRRPRYLNRGSSHHALVPSAQNSLITRTAGIRSGGKSRVASSSLCNRRTGCARPRLKNRQTDGPAAVGTHRCPGESRHGGAVLCKRLCRDLPVTRSIIAKASTPSCHPSGTIKSGLGRSRRRSDGRSSRWIEFPDLSRGRYVYVGLSIASGYRYAPTIARPVAKATGPLVFREHR
jgi:hypothetical protein